MQNNKQSLTPEALKALARQVYAAINDQDFLTLAQLFAPDLLRHAAGETGAERGIQAVKNAFACFPAIRFQVEDLLVEGQKVALRVSVHGVATSPAHSPPTILEIFRIENGRVAEIWGAGSMPAPVPG